MRKGKLAAQVAHASMKVFFDRMEYVDDWGRFESDGTSDFKVRLEGRMLQWMQGLFTKVVVSVDSEEAIHQLEEKAKEAKIPYAVVIDAGLTEFHGVPTITCIAIGPDDPEKIDPITGELPLL
jgi:peptidyl-tRNA hydrolase